MKESIERRISKLEKLVKENSNFKEWSAGNLTEILDEVDDLLTDAVATADDMGDSATSRDLERALLIVRKVASKFDD